MEINRIGINLTDQQQKEMERKASEIIKSLKGFSYRNAKLTLEKAMTELEYRGKAIFDEAIVKDEKDITFLNL